LHAGPTEKMPTEEVHEDVADAEVIEAQEWRERRSGGSVLGEERLQLRPHMGERLVYMPST
jgi:hypothetical protein